MQVTGSVLESLIAKRTEYWENCNRTLATGTLSETGEPPVKCSNVNYLDCHYLCEILIILVLQGSTVKEHLTRLCVGPIHLQGMCRSPVLLTYRGSARVMLFYHFKNNWCMRSQIKKKVIVAFTILHEWPFVLFRLFTEWITRQTSVRASHRICV